MPPSDNSRSSGKGWVAIFAAVFFAAVAVAYKVYQHLEYQKRCPRIRAELRRWPLEDENTSNSRMKSWYYYLVNLFYGKGNDNGWLPIVGISIAVVAAGILYKLFYSETPQEKPLGKFCLRPERLRVSKEEMDEIGYTISRMNFPDRDFNFRM